MVSNRVPLVFRVPLLQQGPDGGTSAAFLFQQSTSGLQSTSVATGSRRGYLCCFLFQQSTSGLQSTSVAAGSRRGYHCCFSFSLIFRSSSNRTSICGIAIPKQCLVLKESEVVRNSDSTRDCSKTTNFANSLQIYAHVAKCACSLRLALLDPDSACLPHTAATAAHTPDIGSAHKSCQWQRASSRFF